MSELIYIDTNVWIDFFLNRNDGLRPLGDFAHELLIKTSQCKYEIVISDWLLKELTKTDHIGQYKELEGQLLEMGKIKYVRTEHRDIFSAKQERHWHDALHEILAIKSKALYLVTRNIKDFKGKEITIIYPENL